MSKRNPSIELWRCFCMFAVVLGHVLVDNGLASRSWFLWHIPGFLIISGFFGINSSIWKYVKLLFIVWSCYWMTIPFRGGETLVSFLLPHGGWFFPFYITMMLTAVIWNSATEYRKNDLKIVIMIGVLLTMEMISRICPRAQMLAIVTGNNEWGFLLMLSTYLLARLVSQRQVVEKVNGWACALLFIGSIVLSVILGSRFKALITYSQPISVLSGLFGFLAFSKIKRLPEAISRVVCFIAPSMFSVYLLHVCCVKQCTHVGCCAPTFTWAVGRASVIFIACVILDLCRRWFFFMMEKLYFFLMKGLR